MKPIGFIGKYHMCCVSYHMTVFGGYLKPLTNTIKHAFSMMAVYNYHFTELILSTEVMKIFRAVL
jgi:hypothetical protein